MIVMRYEVLDLIDCREAFVVRSSSLLELTKDSGVEYLS